MSFLRELWLDVRDTVLVIAQVISLGVIAMVLGLLALNAVLTQPAAAQTTPQSQPNRPLTDLVPTIVPNTPTPLADATASPTPRVEATQSPIYQPPGFLQLTATATPEPAAPTATARPEPTATPVPPTPKPEPTDTPRPEPTAKPQPSPTSSEPGRMMKILPDDDGLPARLRAEPTTKSPILIRVPLGAAVEVLEQASGDEVQPGNDTWVKIRWRNITGWVYSSLVG